MMYSFEANANGKISTVCVDTGQGAKIHDSQK